jgi:hypothetical protein
MLFLFLFLITSLFFPKNTLAQEKNIVGLHLTQPQDLQKSASLINSSGGDWGWVTITIRLDQLDFSSWQSFFNDCRQSHLVPLVRLATYLDQGVWAQPKKEHLDQFSSFLNQLNWPTQRQHIILFNEVNRADEWGGQVDPLSFSDLAIYARQAFKEKNDQFYLLSPGLDLAAPNQKDQYQKAFDYYRAMYEHNPDVFNSFDALSSHSYPNHGYVGTPADQGPSSILGYQHELVFLKKLGVNKEFPVFITETGWPHREGESNENSYYTAKTTADFLIQALNIWQADPQIQAVTPFIYNYPYPPFDHFSWLDKEEKLYPEYQVFTDFPKIKNEPEQVTSWQMEKYHLPLFALSDKTQEGSVVLKNTGQSIWGEKPFCLNSESTQNIAVQKICLPLQERVLPNQHYTFKFYFQINDQPDSGKSFISWKNTTPIEIQVLNLPLSNTKLYHSKTGVLGKIQSFFSTLFPKTKM